MKINFQDRIDDYLLARMYDAERNSFESDAAEHTGLQEQLQFTQSVQQATRSQNEKFKKILYWMSSIAAVFIVGVFVFNLYNLSSIDLAKETASLCIGNERFTASHIHIPEV